MDINKPDHDIHGEDSLKNRHVSFEHQDLGASGILWFFAIMFISAILIHFAVWGLYRVYVTQATSSDLPTHPLAPAEPTPQAAILQNTPGVNVNKFPQVRLQSDDVSDLERMKKQEHELLTAQPWQDETGKVHIPISRAMELLTQRGLPSRGVQPSQGQANPGATNPGGGAGRGR